LIFEDPDQEQERKVQDKVTTTISQKVSDVDQGLSDHEILANANNLKKNSNLGLSKVLMLAKST